jgi:uncharacterized protein YdeI (BOF family)
MFMQNRNRIQTATGVLSLMLVVGTPALLSQSATGSQGSQNPQQSQQMPGAQQPDQAQPQQPDQAQPAQPQQPDQAQPAQKAVVVTGTILKNGSAFILRDSTGAVYQLDAQEKAAPFEGQSVKITGKLEKATNETALLHVDAIEALAA